MVGLTKTHFNPKDPTVMHIDLNSCFATIEQQANRHLRDKPIVVAAYKSDHSFILAPSIEAKSWGIKMGMRVRDAKEIYPKVIVLEPDPWKYRNVHMALRRILFNYTSSVNPKSIDEFVLDMENCPQFERGMLTIAKEIKQRINSEIGEWLKVSIGIAPNRFLAKTASNLYKPNGLEVIDSTNHLEVFKTLELRELHGISTNNTSRLNNHNIFNAYDFYNASAKTLQMAFHSVVGYYWYMRLRGWEVDDTTSNRQSFSNSVALKDKISTPEALAPLLMKLIEKMASRMRDEGYKTQGINVSLRYKDGKYWHEGRKLKQPLVASGDIYKVGYKILRHMEYKTPVHIIAISCFNLSQSNQVQLELLEDINKKKNLVTAIDNINGKFGNFIITPGRMINARTPVKDRIAFGGVRELEDFITGI